MDKKKLTDILEFYRDEYNMKQFVDIVVLKNRNVPLSIFEHFVTTYSKKYNTTYYIKRNTGENVEFNVYQNYKQQLNGNKKKEFDPYCRCEIHNLIELEYKCLDKMYKFSSSIGQLNFFRWVIKNLMTEYIEINLNEIYNDMKLKIKNNNKK